MKNKKLVAIIELLLVVLVSVLLGWFVLQNEQIVFAPKAEEVESSEELVDNEDETSDEALGKVNEVSETDEETTDEEKEEKEPVVISNPFSFEKINLGLDLAGGVSVVYEAQTEEKPSQAEMDSAVALLRKRLTLSGNTEAEVTKQGDDRIRVEMPGVSDPTQAVETVGQTAQLSFWGINSIEDIIQTVNIGDNVFSMYDTSKLPEVGEFVLSGENVKDAYRQYVQVSQTSGTEPVVVLELDAEGTKAFADATEKFMGKSIAIVLDNDIISCPMVQAVIVDGTANITGMSDEEEALNLANLIKSGSLPFKLEPIETNIIGARLGEDALQTSIIAAAIGLLLVVLYMIIVYSFQGVIASLSLGIYLVLMMMTLASFDVTLTLPGIAGMILSIGMAVDANVIIFTRVREEIKLGKTVSSAIKSGFEKGLSAIVDGNVTTLIIAGILYWKGIGVIRGFAQTLTIGIILSMFTAIIITKFLLNLFVKLGVNKPIFYGVRKVKEEVTTADLNKKHVKKEKAKK